MEKAGQVDQRYHGNLEKLDIMRCTESTKLLYLRYNNSSVLTGFSPYKLLTVSISLASDKRSYLGREASYYLLFAKIEKPLYIHSYTTYLQHNTRIIKYFYINNSGSSYVVTWIFYHYSFIY